MTIKLEPLQQYHKYFHTIIFEEYAVLTFDPVDEILRWCKIQI